MAPVTQVIKKAPGYNPRQTEAKEKREREKKKDPKIRKHTHKPKQVENMMKTGKRKERRGEGKRQHKTLTGLKES